MLFDAISCLVWMNTTIIILLQVTASRDSMKFAPKIGVLLQQPFLILYIGLGKNSTDLHKLGAQ